MCPLLDSLVAGCVVNLNADWEQTGFQFVLLKVQTHNLKCTSFLLFSSSFQSSGKS